MSYQAPSISATGLSIPSYTDILDFYQSSFLNIYGQQSYLGNDSADLQEMSIVALFAADVMNAVQLVYTNMGPSFAIGPALDILVKLNGLTRKPASYSTCLVTVNGVTGTVITNGVVYDLNNNLWNLPASVTIAGGGTTVTATAQQPGPITVAASQIIGIATTQAGWTSVTNGSNLPNLGEAAEPDSQLRSRQAISTELPSIALIAGMKAALEAVSGVTRVNIDENYTGATNGNGTPAHSVQCVVENGDPLAVATAIYTNKSIGCGTYGSTSETVIDPITGLSNAISFDTPTYVTVYVKLGVHQLSSWNNSFSALIQNAVLAYLQGLSIGQNVSFISTMAAAMAVNLTLDNPAFIIETASSGIGTSPSPSGTSDISITFDEAAQSALGNIVISFV